MVRLILDVLDACWSVLAAVRSLGFEVRDVSPDPPRSPLGSLPVR